MAVIYDLNNKCYFYYNALLPGFMKVKTIVSRKHYFFSFLTLGYQGLNLVGSLCMIGKGKANSYASHKV